MACYAQQAGYRIVAVSDSGGGLYNPDGLDPHRIFEAKHRGGSVTSVYCEGSVCDYQQMQHDNATLITNDEVLATDADVLVCAALDNQVREDNADMINARVVLELANGPVTPTADALLADRGVAVVPDILANAGGVTVSYFEWVQNTTGWYWRPEEVTAALREIMQQAVINVWQEAEYHGTSLRIGAYTLGVRRLLSAHQARGNQQAR